jgi:hypothetical protein
MRTLRLLALLALPLAISACEHVLITEEHLEGLWLREREHVPPGQISEHLDFGADGSFKRDVRHYGYNGQAPSELSGYYTVEGEYRVRDERLELRLVRETSWDALIGGPETVTGLPGEWADAGTVLIVGERMIRTYTTYPADAPVETTVTYHRAGGGA